MNNLILTTDVARTLSSSVSDIDLSGITEGITAMIPIVIPVVVGMIALRKGLSFLKSQIKGC